MDLRKFCGPFLLYADTVRNLVIKANAYHSPEWFASQLGRIGRAYSLDEPVEMIAATISAFGKGAMIRRTKTPRQMATRIVKVPGHG